MTRKKFYVAIAVLLFIDLMRLLFTFSIGPTALCVDARQYWEMGARVNQGDWFLMTMPVDYRTPAYGWLIGLIRSLFGNYALMTLVAIQQAMVSATSILTGVVCGKLTHRRDAFLWGWGLSLCCFTRSWYANVVLAETLFTLTFIAFLWACVSYWQQSTTWRAVALSLVLAATIMVRPVPQLLCIPLIIVMLMNTPTFGGQLQFRNALGHILLVVVALSLAMGPWYIRNQALFGDWFLTKLPVENKWQVCFQGGSGANLPLPNVPATRTLLRAMCSDSVHLNERNAYAVSSRLRALGLDQSEIDGLVSELCWTAIVEHPGEFLVAGVKRAVNFWRCVSNRYPAYCGAETFFDNQQTWRASAAAQPIEYLLRNACSRSVRLNEISFLCVAAGCIMLFMQRSTRGFATGLVVIFAYFTAVTAAVEIENYRYRMVLEPAMIIACVGGLLVRRAAPIGMGR